MTVDEKNQDLELKWYIVHTYSGFEHKVKINLVLSGIGIAKLTATTKPCSVWLTLSTKNNPKSLPKQSENTLVPFNPKGYYNACIQTLNDKLSQCATFCQSI